jgi:hypothetical protein
MTDDLETTDNYAETCDALAKVFADMIIRQIVGLGEILNAADDGDPPFPRYGVLKRVFILLAPSFTNGTAIWRQSCRTCVSGWTNPTDPL